MSTSVNPLTTEMQFYKIYKTGKINIKQYFNIETLFYKIY